MDSIRENRSASMNRSRSWRCELRLWKKLEGCVRFSFQYRYRSLTFCILTHVRTDGRSVCHSQRGRQSSELSRATTTPSFDSTRSQLSYNVLCVRIVESHRLGPEFAYAVGNDGTVYEGSLGGESGAARRAMVDSCFVLCRSRSTKERGRGGEEGRSSRGRDGSEEEG